MRRQSPAGASEGATLLARGAFDADGALQRDLLDRPVIGRKLATEGAGTSARLAALLGTGETLLVFLRHLG